MMKTCNSKYQQNDFADADDFVVAEHMMAFDLGFDGDARMDELRQRAEWCLSNGLDREHATEKCLDWNNRNVPPLDADEVRKMCEAVYIDALPMPEVNEADTIRMIQELNAKYAWIESYCSIYNLTAGKFIPPSSFRMQFANRPAVAQVEGKLKATSLGYAWIKSRHRRQHADVVYEPGRSKIYEDKVNLWHGWGCEAKPGSIDQWVTFLDYVFAGDLDSRKWFEQWVAYPFQHPGAKLNCAVVMWSARQGMGKTLIGETIGRLYGADNFRTLSAAELHSAFNGWAMRCQFVLGEENASSDARADNNRLKHLITGETIIVNEKYQPAITLRNGMNFLFTSNHPDAFFLESFDRRFFIWEITGDRMPDAFYADFVDWRDNRGGTEALMHHFGHLDLTGFNPKAPAPITRAKLEMIDTSRSDLERFLCEMRDEPELALNIMGREVVSLEDVVRVYNAKGGGRVNTTSVGKALSRLGNRDKRRIKVRVGRPWLYAISRLDHWRTQENDAWAAEYERPSSAVLALIT